MQSPAAQPPVLKRKQQQQNKLKKKKSTPPIKIRMKDVSSGLSPVQNPLKTEANIKKRALTFCRGQRDVAIRGKIKQTDHKLAAHHFKDSTNPPSSPSFKVPSIPQTNKRNPKTQRSNILRPLFFNHHFQTILISFTSSQPSPSLWTRTQFKLVLKS